MKTILVTLTLVFVLHALCKGQTKTDQPSKVPIWTEADRKYLLDNLTRSKQEIIDETKQLTKAQWNFKESPDRWSINQVVEHIAIWELLLMREISVALQKEPDPTFTHFAPDSIFLGNTGTKRNALDYTKPFSFAIPLGNNEGQNNVIWLTTMRNESIEYLKKETKNIRLQYDCQMINVHQHYMGLFRHNDKHLIQIRKVKAHPNYPK